MDVKELKNYIFENGYIEQILDSIGCHHIKHRNGFFQCANPDGDNQTAICVYENEFLQTIDYTRQIIKGTRATDLIDLVCFFKDVAFPDGLKIICENIGLSYYHDFDDDIPESFKILKMLEEMDSNYQSEKEIPLKPISEKIVEYYKPYVNDLFYEDNIDYVTQKEFEIGFDLESNRYTIPIRSELGDLVGIKGRYFERDVPVNQNKYTYLEPCAKSKILYGLYKTINYIKNTGIIYVVESEKAVLQCWSMGYKNAVATGGKIPSYNQIDMIVRLGARIILSYDKDVTKEELEMIAERFPNGVPIYYMFDEEDILKEKESPSDNPKNWNYMIKNNIYRLR